MATERVCAKLPQEMVRIWLAERFVDEDEVGGCSSVAQLEEVESDKTSGSRVSSVEINIANLVACFRLRHTLTPTIGTSHIALFISACRRGGPLSGSRAILGMFEG